MRARSPSREPPERLDEGSTARTATVRPRSRHSETSADRSVDLPAPGGPVTPTRCAGASPPSSEGETSARSAAAASRSARFSITLRAVGAAERSPDRSRLPSSAGSAAMGRRTLAKQVGEAGGGGGAAARAPVVGAAKRGLGRQRTAGNEGLRGGGGAPSLRPPRAVQSLTPRPPRFGRTTAGPAWSSLRRAPAPRLAT